VQQRRHLRAQCFPPKIDRKEKTRQKGNSIFLIIHFKWVQKYRTSHETHKNSAEHNKEISLNIKIITNFQLPSLYIIVPSPVTAHPKAWVCRRSVASMASLNHAEGVDIRVVSVVCCAGDGLCDELITHAEESYRLHVSVCDTET